MKTPVAACGQEAQIAVDDGARETSSQVLDAQVEVAGVGQRPGDDVYGARDQSHATHHAANHDVGPAGRWSSRSPGGTDSRAWPPPA